jgi:cysteine-S-conjugate beta-lyase
MKYNFSEVLTRQNTSAVKLEMCNAMFGSEDVLPMWVADMDFATPPFIIDAIKSRLDHPILGYTIRGNEYNSSIVNWQKKRFGWDVDAKWLSYCPGIVAGLNHAVQTFTKPGDKVIINTPVYHPFFYAVKQNGRELVQNPLLLTNGRYEFDFQRFEEQVKEGAKLFILCSPHNPVGRVWTKDELTKIATICIENKVLIISDEIHADLIFQPYNHIPIASIDTNIANSVLTFGSASKTFNIAGLATAYAIASNQQMLKRYNLQMERNGTWHGNLIGYEATKAAYSVQGEGWLEQLLVYLNANVSLVKEYLPKYLPKIKLIEPEGTYLLWLDFRELGLDKDEIKRILVFEAKLGLNAGEIFGADGDGFQRMNIACPTSIVTNALERLKNAFEKF